MSAQISVNRLPLHIEISEMLARDIEAGALQVGTRLAPEREMALDLSVSVGTLRKALLDLTQKGLIERVHGSGNYVRKPKGKNSAKTIYSFFRLELVSGGGLPTANILSLDKLKKPANLKMLGDGEYAYRIRRLRQLNKLDAAIEEIWIDAPKDRQIKEDDLSDSLYLFYREKLGFWITNVEDQVSALKLPDWKPEEFGKSEKDNDSNIWGYIERLSYDNEGGCSEYSKTWFNLDNTRYVSRIQ